MPKKPTKTNSKNKKKETKKAILKKTVKKTAKKEVAKKAVKKVAVKKAASKKVAKKIAKKAAPKKAVKKAAPKKAEKKAVKKAEKKAVKNAEKKTVKKAAQKKQAAKKTIKKPAKKLEKKAVKKTAPKKPEKKQAKIEKDNKKEQKTAAPKNNIIEFKPKTTEKKLGFKSGEYAVYPSHGIGKIIDIEKTVILGQDFSCYLMFFEKERLTIKVPLSTSDRIGLRKLASKEQMEEVFSILRSGVKKMKGMWSRRAQEYETKINSGDIIALAEVLRDLARDIEDGERSYSERIIYETAVTRLATEYGAIHKIDFETAKEAVISTAKDKLAIDEKAERKKDEFDEEFDEIEDEEFEDEDDDDDDFDDDDDEDQPRKRG